MGQGPRYRTLRDYLAVVRARRVSVVLCILLFAGAAAAVTIPQTPEYEAEASLNFKDLTQELDLLGDAGGTAGPPQTTGTVNAEFVESPAVAAVARRKLRSRKTLAGLDAQTQAQPEASTGFVVIRARSTSAQDAANVANAFAEAADEVRTRREKRRLNRAATALRNETLNGNRGTRPPDAYSRSVIGERIGRIKALADFAEPVEIAKRADVPATAASPRVTRTILLGLLVGLVVGLVVAFTRDVLDTRVRTPADIRREGDLQLLGVVPEKGARGVPGGRRRQVREQDAFRIVRTNLDFLSSDRPVRTVAVTSAVANEGKTTVATALAWATAAAGRSALLVECDLRRPQLAGRLHAPSSPGLTELLAGRVQTADAIHQLTPEEDDDGGPRGRLDFMPVGEAHRASMESLGSAEFRALIEVLTRNYDLVILDTTPVLPVADTLQIAPLMDAVILCARASHTTREQLRGASDALARITSRPVGVVLSGTAAGQDTGAYPVVPARTVRPA